MKNKFDATRPINFADTKAEVAGRARPKEPDTLDQLVVDYARKGTQITVLGNLGRPAQVRQVLGLEAKDFVTCGFMGSSPGPYGFMREIAQRLPQMLGQINDRFRLSMPLLSGGGNWGNQPPTAKTGLMARWAYGATRHKEPSRFVITQGLVAKEGVAQENSSVLVLKQSAAGSRDARLGLRTDGLLYGGDLFWVLFGGGGTGVEKLQSIVNLGIDNDFPFKKFVVIDMAVQNPKTNKTKQFWGPMLEWLQDRNDEGFISDHTARQANDNCLVYRPAMGLSPEQISREMVSITLAIREMAPTYDPTRGYPPLSKGAKRLIKPLHPGSSIGYVFERHAPPRRSWTAGSDFFAAVEGPRPTQPTKRPTRHAAPRYVR